MVMMFVCRRRLCRIVMMAVSVVVVPVMMGMAVPGVLMFCFLMFCVLMFGRFAARRSMMMLVGNQIVQPRRTDDGAEAVDGEEQPGQRSRPHEKHGSQRRGRRSFNEYYTQDLRRDDAGRWTLLKFIMIGIGEDSRWNGRVFANILHKVPSACGHQRSC